VEHTQPTTPGDAELGRPVDVPGGPSEGTASGVVVDGTAAAAATGTRRLTALIVDWGGVLTAPLDTAMTSWAEADGVDFAHFADVMRNWVGSSGSGPVASGGGGGGEPVGATAATVAGDDGTGAGGDRASGDRASGARSSTSRTRMIWRLSPSSTPGDPQ
jgi:hypothetical protein